MVLASTPWYERMGKKAFLSYISPAPWVLMEDEIRTSYFLCPLLGFQYAERSIRTTVVLISIHVKDFLIRPRQSSLAASVHGPLLLVVPEALTVPRVTAAARYLQSPRPIEFR